MGKMPVIFYLKHKVVFLGYASRFDEAYALCKDACKQENMIFKKANTRCSSTNGVHLSLGATKTEFPCWLHAPTHRKRLSTKVEISATTTKPKKKGK